jgi:hypothetical protein
MDRRTFLGVTLGTLAPLAGDAQPAGRGVRIGMLRYQGSPGEHDETLRQALRDLGVGLKVVTSPSSIGGRTVEETVYLLWPRTLFARTSISS